MTPKHPPFLNQIFKFGWIHFTEVPSEFTKLLEDTKGHEKDDKAVLSCELNKPNKTVKWTKDGKVVRANRNLKIVVDTFSHQLVFTDVTAKDAGTYTCTYGKASTSATFTVGGKKESKI